MHLTDCTTDRLVTLAEAYVSRSFEIPTDLYYLLIERGIDASAIAMGEPDSTAGYAQHSQD